MTASKIVAAAASGVGGAGLDVDEVFSTTLWTGTGSSQTITNGIDVSSEGGLIWTKIRSVAADSHYLFDTENGVNKSLMTDLTSALTTNNYGVSAFNNNGFTYNDGYSSGKPYVAWTFRKAPKFFDIVKYTGNGSVRTIAHNLGSTPGMIVIKRLDSTIGGAWTVFHRSSTDTDGKRGLLLNTTDSQYDYGGSSWDVSEMSSTHFGLGSANDMNGQDRLYVAYLFAHNNSDGGFGPDSDQDIIKCGSISHTNGSDTTVDLGFEPQWLMVKCSSTSGNWFIVDNMRGITTGGNDARLYADSSGTESEANSFDLTSSGFILKSGFDTHTYIYMAIRRGPLAVPEDATDVFAVDDSSTTDIGGYTLNSNFPVDFYFFKNKGGGDSISIPRLTVGDLRFNSTGAEDNRSSVMNFDSNTGVTRTSFQGGIDSVDYAFRRAPGYFDVVAYTGTGSSSARAVPHGLTVVPEMMWVKRRDSASGEGWAVYHKGLNGGTDPEDYYVSLNSTAAEANNFYRWADTAPTATNFYVTDNLDASGGTFIAYLFATVAGVSKVGSYTGTGSALNIDCGFSSGARFVLIKSSTQATEWNFFDTARGIVSGNDPVLFLDATAAEVTNGDFIDPHSSGFTINYVTSLQGCNTNGQTYIFYAIA